MFGKQKTKTAEEILEAIEALSGEEKAKVLSALNPSKEEAPATEAETGSDDATQTEEPEAESTGDETGGESDAQTEEAGAETQTETVNEEPQETVAEEPAEPVESTEPAEPAVKDDDERYNALVARIEALEATLNDMKQAQEDAVEEEHDRDFGMSPSVSEGNEEDSRYSRVLRGYAKDNAKNYI